jgi:hypothetical protein
LNETGIWLWKSTLDSPADFNDDHTVDAADYAGWRKIGGAQTGQGASWRTHFGEWLAAGSAIETRDSAVPEPSALALLILALIGTSCRSRPRPAQPPARLNSVAAA